MDSPEYEPHPSETARSHVFILGSGASRAAFPPGNEYGINVPLFDDLLDMVELRPLLASHGINAGDDNFEVLYSKLSESGDHTALLQQLDSRVFDYFAALHLPDAPTLYDYLVLSLRPKDLIATFNWDPFLWDALTRIACFAPVPQSVYLHGNVAIGHCANHRPATLGRRGKRCGQCGATLEPSQLLYPVAQKHYNQHQHITTAWDQLNGSMQNAFLLTIFGYGAPRTDVEAVELMRQAWGQPHERDFEQIEIIDIRDESDLYSTWNPFIYGQHFEVCEDFYQSIAGKHPRRSVEDMQTCIIDGEYVDEETIPHEADWPGVRSWYSRLVERGE